MTRLRQLLAEFEAESATTRRHLLRVPGERFDWQPHPRSFTLRHLGSHLVDCIAWTPKIFGASELDMDPDSYEPFMAEGPDDLLAAFDRVAAEARHAIEGCRDVEATDTWTLKMGGAVWFQKPREAVFRDLTLSHMIHHRGQLSVYLRLLGVPVPGSYGPTADERN